MNTKHQRYREALLSCRIRSARQKIRMQYEDFDKQLIQLEKEKNWLNQQKKNLGWEVLDIPYQKGWVRNFVLRQDIAVSKHANFFEAILKKINTYQYNWRKDFKRKKRKGGKRNYTAIPQNIKRPGIWEFKMMEFTEREKQFFYEMQEINAWGSLEKKYVFHDLSIFILKISPNMIGKIRKADGELESAIKRIDNYLEKNDFEKHQQKILYGHYQWKPWKKLRSTRR